MPNINLLQTINTASNTDGYFIMSNNGLARRFRYNDLVSQLRQTDLSRTNQDLYTYSQTTFKSVTLQDSASSLGGDSETQHGIQSNYRNVNGGAIQAGDFIGAIRFGGYDGNNNTLLDNGLASAGVTAVATENWASNGNRTIAAGSGVSLFHQPVNTQLTTSTRVTSFSVLSTATSANAQAVSIVRIGSATTNPLVVTTSSNGLATFIGPGRADLFFSTARLHQSGVTSHDTAPINSTITGTNSFMFVTSRYSTAPGLRQPLKNGDDLAVFLVRAATSPNTITFGEEVAGMGFDATSDYTPPVHGSLFYVRTCSTATNAVPIRTFVSSPEVSRYASNLHIFTNQNSGNALVIDNGTLVFGDSTVQNTAYPGFTTVPSSSNSPGTPGQMAHDSTYFYICVATNQWKRILAADF
jgi:hypothetical protein